MAEGMALEGTMPEEDEVEGEAGKQPQGPATAGGYGSGYPLSLRSGQGVCVQLAVSHA